MPAGRPMPRDKTTQGESLDQEWPIPEEKLRRKLAVPSQGRLYYIRYAMKMGWTIEQIHELTNIDRWFLGQMKELVDFEAELIDSDDRARDCQCRRCRRRRRNAASIPIYRSQAKAMGLQRCSTGDVLG